MDGGYGRFEACELAYNLSSQLQVLTCRAPWEPVLEECAVHAGSACGVMVRIGGAVRMNKCKVRVPVRTACTTRLFLALCFSK
jgi:hypothetical protein